MPVIRLVAPVDARTVVPGMARVPAAVVPAPTLPPSMPTVPVAHTATPPPPPTSGQRGIKRSASGTFRCTPPSAPPPAPEPDNSATRRQLEELLNGGRVSEPLLRRFAKFSDIERSRLEAHVRQICGHCDEPDNRRQWLRCFMGRTLEARRFAIRFFGTLLPRGAYADDCAGTLRHLWRLRRAADGERVVDQILRLCECIGDGDESKLAAAGALVQQAAAVDVESRFQRCRFARRAFCQDGVSAADCNRIWPELLAMPTDQHRGMLHLLAAIDASELDIDSYEALVNDCVDDDNLQFYADTLIALCGTRGTPQQRCNIVRSVMENPLIALQNTEGFCEAVPALACNNLDGMPEVICTLNNAWVSEHNMDFITWARPFCERVGSEDAAGLLDSLFVNVSVEDRAAFASACAGLLESPLHGVLVADYIDDMTDREPRDWDNAAREYLARHPNGVVDTENVMHARRISRTEKAIAWLQGEFSTQAMDVGALIRKFATLLEAIAAREIGTEPYASLHRKRNGQPEYANAQRILVGPADDRDFTEPLNTGPLLKLTREDIRLDTLLALVWAACERYVHKQPTPQQEAQTSLNLTHSLLLGLAQCVEDDGHGVCPAGISQRLVQVVQGYYPEIQLDLHSPQAILLACGAEFEREYPEVRDEATLAAFAARSKAHALTYYPADSEGYALFASQLDDYIELLR